MAWAFLFRFKGVAALADGKDQPTSFHLTGALAFLQDLNNINIFPYQKTRHCRLVPVIYGK